MSGPFATPDHDPLEDAPVLPPRPTDLSHRRGGGFFAVVAVIGVIVVILSWSSIHSALFGSSPSDQSAQVGSLIGATCTSSGYELINRLDNTKTPLYDCVMTISGKAKCVTYENNIANDSTATARFLFASSLGGQKPACLG